VDCSTLEGMGLVFNPEWNVLICIRCRHIVDQSMMINHLTKTHKLKVDDQKLAWRTMLSHKVRPHLLVVWDEWVEREMDYWDDEYTNANELTPEAFRPGSANIGGIAVSDGCKCLPCERALTHRCVQSKEALRTHYKRNHGNSEIEFCPVRVQAFYGRSSAFTNRYV
ncbi:hypothetical protein V1506DRAFT_447754, partial [Lipomyces tetrasporus]